MIFDQHIDRRGSGSVKWDLRKTLYGSDDVIPLWVADMDFPAPGPVIRALTERVEHPVYGYSMESESAVNAVVGRMGDLYGWDISPGNILFMAGVVPSMAVAVRAFSNPGDGVVCMTPVYPPFFSMIKEEGRRVVENPLVCDGMGHWTIDFDDLEKKASGSRILLLCSPHNPVGRVWTRAELERIADIARRNNIIVVSDEIHAEIVYPGAKQIPFASVSADAAARSITCVAASKTFNVAGLATSLVIAPDADMFRRYKGSLPGISGHANLFGIAALEAAYTLCDDWLADLIFYLDGNRRLVGNFFNENGFGIGCNLPEATFLTWLDCSPLGMNDAELARFFAGEAKVGLNPGISFGKGGKGHMRLNFGCPRTLLEEGLERIGGALSRLSNQK